MSKKRKQKVVFKVIKIVSKPVKIIFRIKDGRQVSFKAQKNIPKSVYDEFLAKRIKVGENL